MLFFFMDDCDIKFILILSCFCESIALIIMNLIVFWLNSFVELISFLEIADPNPLSKMCWMVDVWMQFPLDLKQLLINSNKIEWVVNIKYNIGQVTKVVMLC